MKTLRTITLHIFPALIFGASTLCFAEIPTTPSEIPSSTLPGRINGRPHLPQRKDIPNFEIEEELEKKLKEEEIKRKIKDERMLEEEKNQKLKEKKFKEKDQEKIEKEDKTKIYLDEIILDGATLIKDCELKQFYLTKIGTRVTFKELVTVGQAIESYYRKRGYVLARVILPQQKIKQNKAKIKYIIFEGKIAKINIIGNPGKNEKVLHQYLKPITDAPALKLDVLEEKLLLANDIPGIDAKAFITQSKTVVGAAELNLKVNLKNPTGFYTFDNRGTKYIGNKQLLLGGNAFSILTADNLYVDVLKSVPTANQITSFTGLYKIFFGPNGTNAALTYKHTRTEPGEDLALIQLRGTTSKFDFMVNKPIIRSRTKNLFLNSGIYASNNKNVYIIGTFYEDKIRAGYAGINFIKNFTRSFWNLNLKFTKGTDFGSAKTRDHIEKSRAEGSGKFFKTNLDSSYTYNLARNYALAFSVSGQTTKHALLASEEFGYGGELFGNAYDSSEIIGDKGINGKVEMRYNIPKQFADINYIQLFSAYDYGKVWNNRADVAAQVKKISASTLVFGIRIAIFNRLFGSLEAAQPLTRKTAADGVMKTRYFGKLTFNI